MAETHQDTNTVCVTNISGDATEKTVSDFFSFCGKITNLYLKKDEDKATQTAVVQFETESAAKTALLLTHALIIDLPITVEPMVPPTEPQTPEERKKQEEDLGTRVAPSQITQRPFQSPDDERSKTSAIASLLAAGYVLAHDTLDKAKDYDEKHNFSLRAKVMVEQVKAKAHEIDQTYHISETASSISHAATEKIKQIDTDYHISERASQTAATVKSTASAAAAKAQEVPAVASAVSTLKNTASRVSESVSSTYNQYKEETNKAIAEKERQRSASKEVVEEVEAEMEKLSTEETTAPQ